MGKLVVLELDGDFEQGFRVWLKIWQEEGRPSVEIRGQLPPVPELVADYDSWQLTYRSLDVPGRIKPKPGQVTNFSIRELKENCYKLGRQLGLTLNAWLRAESFRPVRESLLVQLTSSDDVRVMIQTEDNRLRRLPWHLWDLLEHNPRTEIALSAYDSIQVRSQPLKGQVRILAILGNSEGIDVQADRTLLEHLPGAKTTFLVEPTRQELDAQLRDKRGWDILFFAGHSASEAGGETGRLYINRTDSLTVGEFKYALKDAIGRSLKLGIFNSCDGLGLARELAELHIPQLIVMREPVPDPVAQEFLKNFLAIFARGESFYWAVRKAREQLQWMEGDFPCATWLPAICQNPVAEPLTWHRRRHRRVKPGLLVGVAIAFGVAIGLFINLEKKNFVPILPPVPTPSSAQISTRFSLGERILIAADATPQKQAGVKAFAAGDWKRAIANLNSSLQVKPNDPEALIYLNNAKAASTRRTLKIAVAVPIGSNLNVAREILRGIAQAQDEVNRNGGIDGSLLQVAIANDDNNPEIAKQLATELVKDTEILAVVGHNASDVSVAAARLYQDKLVMISATSFAMSLSEIGSNHTDGNYIFRTVPGIGFVADTLSQYTIKTARKTRIAMCSDFSAVDNQSFRNEFTFAIYADGGKFINIPCNFSAPDFNASAVISQAINAGADGLLLAPHVDKINKAIKVAQANQGQLALFGSPTLHTAETLESGKADVNGLVLAVPWHPAEFPDNPFPKNATKLWGGAVNWRTAMAYDATQAVISGLKQSNKTREGLQKVLSSTWFSVKGATGTVEFLPSGDRVGQGILVKVEPSPQSGTGYDFVPLKP